MSLVTINWTPSKRELQKFGLTMIVGFGLLTGLFFWLGHQTTSLVLAALGVVFGVLGVWAAKPGLWAYKLWMAVAFVLGNIISRLVLILFYYVILTPISLFFKLIGRDRLHRKPQKGQSYWQDLQYHTSIQRYERQY